MKKRTEKRDGPEREARRAEVPRVSRLILTGFMGAGKSTVGAILAERLGWRFIDLDKFIECLTGKTVAEIFRGPGEPYFRRQEQQALQQLSHEKELVLALGGGTIEDDRTRAFLLNLADSCLIFLEAPLPRLLERCAAATGTRPLFTSLEALESRHSRRLPHYRAAHLTVLTTDLAPHQVAEAVLERVSREWRIEGHGLR